jgi:hypothetical protein
MFDCDSFEEYQELVDELNLLGVIRLYVYPTKNGFHVIVNPFNKSILSEKSAALIHLNGMMLWSY